ncbi:MAG: hypothetical protein IJV48_00325 [Ruminococcus sp.]|nr:hypothetical protein [Ruminococcus sp.]
MNQSKSTKGKSAKRGDTPPDNAVKGKKTILTAKRLETVVAVLLGITTLLSAWASWIAHLHGGLQSIHFTESNNTASQSTAEYNLGTQAFLADYMAWNTLKDYTYELDLAKADSDQTKIDLINDKIETFKKNSISDILAEGIKWMEENGEDNPFNMPGITGKYFESAQGTSAQSQELLEEGKRDNTKGDSYQLVTVIYSLTLFLLGIVGTFKNMPNRIAVLSIAVACLILAFIYMCTIPLPTGFAQMNFFEFNQ